MQYTRICGLIPAPKSPVTVDIFGHSSKGVPGVEILGLGTLGRQITEKFIFHSKRVGIKIPIRRYKLCVELEDKTFTKEELRWLELPLLILFWSLTKTLPINRLDDCYTQGKITVSGKVVQYPFDVIFHNYPHLNQLSKAAKKVIGLETNTIPNNIPLIPLESLFAHLQAFDFEMMPITPNLDR